MRTINPVGEVVGEKRVALLFHRHFRHIFEDLPYAPDVHRSVRFRADRTDQCLEALHRRGRSHVLVAVVRRRLHNYEVEDSTVQF